MFDIRPSSPRRDSRRIRPLATLTAAAALCTGLIIAGHSAHQQTRAAAPAPTPAAPPAHSGYEEDRPAATTTAAATAAGASAGAQVIGGQAAAAGPVDVRYSFDDGARQPVLDSTAGHPLRIVAVNGGTIRYVARAGGWAVQFPARCQSAASSCPRAILQGGRDDSLNPGTRTIRYGAAVLMTRADTAAGANVLQKGYSVGGASQYKLQVDHAAGRPSCVIASRTMIYRAESAYTVADGQWHTLACQRAGNRLTLHVDGTLRATRTVPASLSIVNTEPLRIGGKGTTANNDQYAGRIDNVYVSIP